MRTITLIIVHCTANKAGSTLRMADIYRYHRSLAKPWAMRFLWIKVRVSYYQRFRITLMQFTKQPYQRTLLCFRPCVARSLAIAGKSSYIRYTNRMAVMISTMRSNALLRSSSLDDPVGRNHIVIPTASPTERTMIAVNIRHSQCAARLIGE